LNALQCNYHQHGFHVLGMPCNQFGYQEPSDTPEELLNGLRYVRPGKGFLPNFQLFEMTEVNGKNSSELYKYLKSSCPPPVKEFHKQIDLEYEPYHSDDVRWNFEKFLINRNGKVVMRFQSYTKPEEIVPFIEALLKNESFENLKKLACELENCE
jgi:glutathione peroxidase